MKSAETSVDLTVEDVTFRYSTEVTALRSVSLQVVQGEKLVIVGENGAGKSTLAKHLNGLLKPGSGRVFVGGWDTREFSTAKIAARVGLAFQNPDEQLFKRTVRAEVAFGPQNLGFGPEETEAAVQEALEMVGLAHEGQRHPHDLQSAQRRLVALAAVFAMRTPVIIIDEPTIGQDARGKALLGKIINHLHELGRTVIAISHDIEFCATNFDRFVVMADGQISADGPRREIFPQRTLLAHAHVEPPQIMRLAETLALDETVVDIPSFLEAWREG